MSKFMDGFRFDLQLFADNGEHSLADGASLTSGGTTYTAVGSAKLRVANGGTRVTLLEGTVSFSGGPLFWGNDNVNIRPLTSSTATVSAENGVTKVAGTSTVQVQIPANATIKIAGKTYTATLESQANLTLHGDGSGISRVVLGSGAVGIASGASVEVNNITYTNTSTDGQTVTVSSSAKSAELPPGASVQIGNVTYTNTSTGDQTVTVPSGGTVTLEKGASVQINGFTYKNTSTEDANNTITVGVDANGNGAVSWIDGKATCAVSVPQGKSIVFGANKFTVVSGPATSTFTADADYAPTLKSDSVVTIDTPYALKAKGVEVTNSSDANSPKSVTVDAKGAYAKITTADGGACTVSFPAAGTTAEIAGSLYTSKKPATLDKTGDTMKLTAGAVTIGRATLQTGNNNATITNKNDKKITVESGSIITDVENGAEFDVTISNTSSTIEGMTYKTEKNDSAAFTVTKSNGKTTTTLTSGTLIIPDELADGQTVVVNAGAKFRTKPITYETGMTTYKVWVDPTGGTRQITLEGLNGTVNITSLKSDNVWGMHVFGGDTIYLNGVPYKAGAGGLNIRLEGSSDDTFTPFIKKENNSLLLDPGAFIDYINSADDSCKNRITITNPNNSGKIVTVKTNNYSSSDIVTIEDGGTVQIKPAGTQASPVTYTAVGGQAQLSLENVAKDSSALTWVSGKVKLNNGAPIIIGGKTYTAAADDTTLSADADGKIALTSGEVVIPDGGTVTANGVAFTPSGGTMTVDSTGAIVDIANGVTYTVALGANQSITVDGQTYKNLSADGDVTLTVTKADSKVSVACAIAAGKSAAINGKTYTVGTTDVTFTVTNGNGGPFIVPSGSSDVLLGAGAYISFAHLDQAKIRNDGAAGSTVTVAGNVVKAISDGAVCFANLLGANKTVTFGEGGTTYTSPASIAATVSATALNTVTLTSGSIVVAPGGSVVTSFGTVMNNDTEDGHTITVNAADGTVTPAAANADYTVALNNDAEVTINGTKYYGSAGAVIHVTKQAGDTKETVTLTGGTVALGQGAKIVTDIGTVMNDEEPLITVSKDGTTIMKATKEEVSAYNIYLIDGADVTINDRTYTNSSGAKIHVGKAAGSTELREILYSGQVSVATNASVDTNIGLFTNKGTAEIVVDGIGFVQSVKENAEAYEYRLTGTNYVNIDGKHYTNIDSAVIDVTKEANATDLTVTLTSGSVALRTGASIITQSDAIGKITNNNNDYHNILTVTSDGTITENRVSDFGEITAAGNSVYTVEIKAGKTATLGGQKYTTPAGQTAEIRVVMDREAEDDPPTYTNTLTSGAVILGNGTVVNINGVVYKATAAQTTLSVDSEQKATLTSGAVELTTGTAIVANGVTVTNISDTALKVAASGTNQTDVTVAAGESVLINGVTYRNMTSSTATITAKDGEVTLPTDGSFKPVSEVSIVGMATGKTYVLHTAGTKAGTKEWVADSDVVSGSDTVIARYDENTLTINAANQGAVAVLTGDANGAALKSLTVALGKNNDGNDVSGVTMEFRNSTGVLLGTIGNVSSDQGIYFDDTMTVTIPVGCTAGNMTATEDSDPPTIHLATSAEKCELIKGTVELAKGKSAVISYVNSEGTDCKGIYTAASDSTATIKKAADAQTAELTDGKVTFSSAGAAIVAKGVTVTKNSTGTLTVDATGGSAVVTNGEKGSCTAEIGAGKAVTIDGETFKNTSETETATITKQHGQTAKLETGGGSVSVAFGKGVSVSANRNEISNEATANENNTITVNDRGEVTAIADNGVAKVVIAKNHGTTIVGTTYNSANSATATIKMAHGGTAELISGSVIIPSGGRLTANDCTFQVGWAASPITVDSDGKVTLPASSMPPYPNYQFDITIPAGKTASVNEKTYTAKDKQVKLQINPNSGGFRAYFAPDSEGSVVLGAGAAVDVKQSPNKYVIFTNTSEDKTVEVDASGLRAMSEGAACTVGLDSGTSVTVAGMTYKTTNGTGLSVRAASALTESGGSAEVTLITGGANDVKISSGAVVIANGVTVTNTATADLTVQAKTGEAIITTAEGGSCSAVIGAGKKATIDGTTYTTTETATITKAKDGAPVLTDGSVTIGVSNFAIQAGDVEITTVSTAVTVACFNGHSALRDGTVTLSSPAGKTATLYSAKTRRFAAGETASVAVAGTATVKAENGVITSIKGLDANGEIFTVTKYEDTDNNPETAAVPVVYTYAVDSVNSVDNAGNADNVVWKKTDPSGKVFYVDHMKADSDVLDSDGANWVEAVTVDKAFRWEQGVFVFTRANGVKITDGRNPKDVEPGVTYIEATVGADGALALAAKNGTPLHGLMDNDGEDDTFNVDANGAGKIVYIKDSGLKATVVFTNVAKDSEISGLGANDTIATATLQAGDKVVVDGVSCTAAAAGALRFKGDALASGTVMADAAEEKPLKILDGSTVYTTAAGTSARLTVASDGTIASVTGLAAGNTVVVRKGGVTTTYEAVTDTIIQKTVLGYTGDEKEKNGVFITTLAKAGNDVVTGGAGTDAYARVLNLVYGSDGKISFDGIWNSGAAGSDGAGGGTHIYYYKVTSSFDETTGVTTCTIGNRASSGVNLTSDNYFKAVYTDATGSIVLTYHQGTAAPISAVDLLGAKKPISVDGSTVATTGTITKKLTLTETIPCMVTDLPAAVKTVDTKGVAGSDYAYKDTYTITTPITLGTGNAAWYRVNVVTAGSKANYGVNTCTLTQTTSEPTGAENYFSVTKTVGGYTVNYVPATVGNAFDLSGTTVDVNASGAPQDKTFVLMLTDSPRPAAYHVIGAPAGMKLSGVGAQDMISYTSTFTWPTTAGTYTYFTPATDASGNPVTELPISGTTVIVAPEADPEKQKTYNKLTVRVGGDLGAYTYAIAVTGVKQTATGVDLTEVDTSLRTITVPSGCKNIDASELKAGMTLAGVDNEDTVTAEGGIWNSLTVSGTGSFTVTDGGSHSASFTAETGSTISVKGGKCVDGVFALKAGDSALTGSKSSPVSGEYIKATLTTAANTTDAGAASTSAGDGKVSVTFRDGVIASITGLEAGETLTVTQKTASGSVAYSYTYDKTKGMVTRSDGLVAGADDSTANVLSLDYGVYTTPLKTNGFAWATGDYYVRYTGSAANLTPTTRSENVTSASYIHAHYDSATKVLTLEPVTGTKKGMVNPDESFAGTISVTASKDAPIKYTKSESDNFTVNFTNVGKGSVFTDLTGTDKVSASLGKGESVTVNGGVYTAATETTLTFEGGSAKTGTFLLDGSTPTITASAASSTNVIIVSVTYNNNTYTGETANRNIAVTLSNGRLTAITGLDASTDKTGEKVTVTTTVIDKNGTESTSTAVYTAALSTETGKAGQITVTREQDGTKMVHTFSTSGQNLLDGNAVWTTDDYVTKRSFDWSNTGYFRAVVADPSKPTVYSVNGAEDADGNKADTVKTGELSSITKADAGKVFLRVVSQQATPFDAAKITSMSLVKVMEDGSLAAYSGGTIGAVEFDAAGAGPAGFSLPSHSFAATVGNAASGAAYKGLNASDTVRGKYTKGNDPTITVGNVSFILEALNAYQATEFEIKGNGTITEGIFTVTGSATGSAKALHNGDNAGGAVTNGIVYTAGEEFADGVSVKFAGGRIVSVTDLEPGEKVVLSRAKGTAQASGMTTTITKDVDNIVTRSVELAGATLVMTRIDNNPETDVLSATGCKVTNKFDFGATTAGRLGVFAVNAGTATVSTQSNTETLAEGRSYLLVDASGSSSSVTINALEVFTDNAGSLEKAKGNTALAKGLTLAAPEGCSLTLAKNAAKLYTTYKLNDAGTAWVKDETENTETSRTYGINVIGASAGMSYGGFGDQDTISSGTLVSGDTVTVNGKTLTLADSAAVSVRGDGKVINGVYKLNSGIESAASLTTAENDKFTAKVTSTGSVSASAAAVKFEAGEVTSITGLTAKNQSVAIAETNAKTGAVKTTTYQVTGVDASTGEMTVIRTVTDDGRTAKATGNVAKDGDVTANAWYGPETGTLTSSLTWNPKNGSGYFLTKATDASKELGEVTVTTGSTTAKAGSYYLRAGYNMTTEQWEFSLHKINTDGTPGANCMSQATGGTVKVAAPSSAVKLDLSTGVPSAVAVNVTGVAAGSEITMANGNASLTTTSLSAGAYLTINGKKVTAAVSGIMEFEGAGGLKNGVVRFDKNTAAGDLTVAISKGSLTVSAPTSEAETPTVTVKNGVVTTIKGNDTTTVTVRDKDNRNQAVYAAKLADVAFSNLANGAEIETAALAEGATVHIGGTEQTYTLGKAGAIRATVSGGALRFREANLRFAKSSGTLYTTGEKSDDASDDKSFSFARNSGESTVTAEIRNGEIMAVKGLRAGDVFSYEGATYTAETSTVIEKVYTDEKGKTQKVTAYISADADILSAAYAALGDDVTDMLVGQFTWSTIHGRSTGYFKVDDSKKTAKVSEQSTKYAPTASKGTPVTYVVANAASAVEGSATPQVLTIEAIRLESDGVITTLADDDAKTLLAGVKITVTAPTASVDGAVPAINYTKTANDTYNIVINKAANGSAFTGLTTGDKVTTATLAIGESVTAGELTYATGVKGTMDFLGEGTASSSETTLLRGTILLDVGNKKALLSGSADGAAEDIEISLNDVGAVDENGASIVGSAQDTVSVNVSKGVVTSIAGLETKGMALTVGTVTYKVLNAEYKLDSKGNPTTTKIVTIERSENGKAAYGTFTLGKTFFDKFDKNGNLTNYTAAVDTPTNLDIIWTDTNSTTEKNGRVIYAAVDEAAETATFAKAAKAESIDGSNAERGKRYLAMTVTTAKGVTTVKKIEVAEIGATGAPAVVKYLTVAAAGLRAVIDCKNDSGFAAINYKIPSTVPVTISNAAVGSSISGIKQNNGKAAGDLITSADEKSRALAKGTVSLYRVVDVDVDADNKADVKRTVETKVTYAPSTTKGDFATIDAMSGTVTKLTDLDRNGEKVTIAETTEKGAQTTVFEVKTVSKVQYVYKTVTDIDGTKKTYRGALGASGYDWIGDTSKLLELVSTDVVAEFDWTMSKNSTGYFAVSTSSKGVVSSTLRAQTKAVTIKDTDKNKYIAVKISGDGVVESVRSVMKNAETGEMIDADTKFSGTLNVKAPVKISLDFDRTKLDGTTIDSASALAVTGAIAGSRLTNLALGDTVTTAKLAKNTETVSLSAAGDGNGVQTFTAGTAGALSFKVRTVDGSAKLSLTGGTVKLDTGDYVYTGDRMITMEKGSVTVTAKTGTNGATYTIGDLKEGAVFTVETFGDGACMRKYMRSANNLFCEIVKNGGTTMAVYEIKTATSAASSVLEQAGVASVKNSKWTNFTESNATFRETDDGLKLVSTAKNAAVTVDLNLLDKRIASDNKTAANQGDNDDYSFIIDKYMANPTKFNGAAAVVADGNLLDLQQVIGTRAGGDKIYTAAGVDIAQTIKVTKEWHVIGSNRNDTITGASSGSDTLEGGAGNDLLTGGVASDKFIVGLGKDTIKSYVTNKDSVSYQDDQGQVKDFNVILTDSDVLLWSDDDEDGSYGAGDSSVLVVGMGNRKALNINGVNYYFGSAKVKKAETFSFDAGSAEQAATSRYYGKAGLANTLSIGTTKAMATKNTLGDTVTADLSDGTRYANISIADASKSGNRVDLKAAAAGSTLKGGTYQSTLRGGAGADSLVGGSGADVFWFDTVEKDDVVTGYTSGKDSVYLGNVAKATAEEIDGLTIAAVGNDVVISSGETGKVTLKKAVSATKAVTVLADEKGMNKLSYYVGKTGSYDKKGNPTGKNGFKATIGKDTADSVAGATAGTFTSYYVGSDSSVDTLTLVGADKKTEVGSETAAATFDMASANLASIDVLDASGLAAGSYLRLVGKAAGTYSLIGSSKATKETFDLKAVKTTDATSVTVKGLDLADVIEIAAGVKATRDDTKSTKTNTYFKLTDSKDATKVYGEILVSGVGKGNFGTEYSAGTIQRSK